MAVRLLSQSLAGSTTQPDRSGRLRRVLGAGFGMAVIVGSMLGIGILRTPGMVAAQLQSPLAIMVLWAVGGGFTLLSAICFSELGTMAPEAGGYYVYARRAFGNWAGFVVGWTDWLTYCAVLGYAAIGMSELVGSMFPAAASAKRLVAVGLLAAFVALQWAGVRISGWFQEWTTALKFLAFVALIVVGLALAGHAAAVSAPPLPVLSLGGIAGALQAIVISYGGWQSALYFAEEDRDPSRNLPRAMIGGVIAVMVVYILVNLALLAILPVGALAASQLPATDAARLIIGGSAGVVMTALSVISLPPLFNAILMIATRILFALGRDRLFVARAAGVTRTGTPDLATIVTMCVAIVLILVVGEFGELVAIAAFFLSINYVVCGAALVVLRRKQPEAARPFRAWGYPWSAYVVIAGALALLAGSVAGDRSTSLIVLACVAVISAVGILWCRLTLVR